jgi:hypothetical protein
MHTGSLRKYLPNCFSLLLIVLLLTNYLVPFGDLDFTWQVRTGERILHTGQLRPTDAFTYTIYGQRVPEFEWLYEVILYCVWQATGLAGLKLLKSLLVAAPLLLLAWRLRREGIRWHGIALALLTAILILSPAWNLRPLYCTTLGLLLVSGWLHDHCQGRQRLSWWLPVVMLVWANLHPGVITGQGLLVGAIAWEWLNRWLRLYPPLDLAGCRRLTVIGGLGALATFVSPDPIQRLLYPFRPELAHSVQRFVSEMQPLRVFLTCWPYVAWPAYLLAALVAASVVLRFRKYRLWEVTLLVGLAGLANVAVRSLQDWVLVMLALGTPHLAILLRRLREASLQWKREGCVPAAWPAVVERGSARALVRVERSCKRMFNGPLLRFQPIWPVAVLGLFALVSLVPPLASRMPAREHQSCPVAAVDWIVAHGLEGRFFAFPDYGSYIGWRLRDRGKSYVDTRGFFFPPELLEDSYYVPQLGPGWRQRLERVLSYGTDYFLLETTGPRGELWQAFQQRIARPLYQDDEAVLLSAAQVREALAATPDQFVHDRALASGTESVRSRR